MTTKTIVRYLPPNPIVGARELTPDDFKAQGVFTQKKRLLWTKETGFWLDADEAKISSETLAWLEEQKGEFKVETQEIPEEEAADTPDPAPESKKVEGEQPVGAGTPGTTTGTTTQSTARR